MTAQVIKIDEFIDNCLAICDECGSDQFNIVVDNAENCNVIALRCAVCHYTEYLID
jgi:hypothetical protein